MSQPLLRSDDIDRVVALMAALVDRSPSLIPPPGSQGDWASVAEESVDGRIWIRAGLAVRRLLDLGASADDLGDLARGLTVSVLSESLTVLADDEGALANEFFYAIEGRLT